MEKSLNWREFVITRAIKASGYSAIVFVLLIFFFLMREGLPALGKVELGSLLNIRWYPVEEMFGILPLVTGSIIVTLGAALIAVPLGIGTAVYIAEIAPRWMREILKPLVELLGGLPSVVLGFLGILIVSPNLRLLLDLPTGLTAFTGSLLLGGIAVPTIVSVAEDALDAVPRSYREGSWALGATKWQTIWRVTLPAAKSGVITAIMLGVGRTIGETMTVMMVTGNAPVLALKLNSLFSPVRTMTATIAAEMGEVANGSLHYHTLFFIGIILFLISLTVNVIASSVVFRAKKRAERILS
ncbi:MAG: phosphate ABC transporter permease subunit PstC [Chloroflexi bacterium]|nr:phosphate ABC transporter permease subunit PstC [Anaerolineales bacterium]MDL1919378.1 phosphate ABC transporter permease subunit PstC [Chloroflexi bacterium CFX5]RIK52023.1 MAG: phosphate ABC transporter permease subunit PstC [Chloroflexota bacterium]